MNKAIGLSALIFTLSLLASTAAHAWAAVAAPTKPVYSKNLNAPHIPSDTRNLEAIINKEKESSAAAPAAQAAGSQPAPAPTPTPAPTQKPQTILMMPSAVTGVPVSTTPPDAAEAPKETAQDASPEEDFPAAESDTSGWYHWTSDPVSVFAAFIAFCAFAAAGAGIYHVYRAGVTARRHLRAYVFVTQTEINGVAAQTQPVAQLAIRNTGQTPGHEVMVYGNMVFDEFPLKKDLPVLVFADPQLTKENLGPGGERYKWEYALAPLTEEQIAQMQAGTHALYVYGEIRYRDVFRKNRSTKYLYFTGGNMGIRGTILGGYPEGNEAL